MQMLDVLRYGHEWLVARVDGLAYGDWTTVGVCGVWSVKDIMAHLASYEYVLADVFRSLAGKTPTPMLDEFVHLGDAFNDVLVTRWAGKSPSETLADYAAGYEEAMRMAVRVPEPIRRQAGTLPWYGDAYALDDFVVYSYYGHKREHGAQIDKFRDMIRR